MSILVDDLVGKGRPRAQEFVALDDRPAEILAYKEEDAISHESAEEGAAHDAVQVEEPELREDARDKYGGLPFEESAQHHANVA